MKTNQWIAMAVWVLVGGSLSAQDWIAGRVMLAQPGADPIPAEAASVFSPETGQGALTDGQGRFRLPYDPRIQRLVARYLGAEPDTLPVISPDLDLLFTLHGQTTLQTVLIEAEGRAAHFSSISPQQTELLTEKELYKAACCNLSESFETNPSVNVTFSDAVTGARQIEFLGLGGKYTLLSQESMPGIRGLGLNQGLALIPGPWVESIQISKGAGSVVNGFEGITGQINYELKKPISEERIFVNGYQNLQGRSELNLNLLQRTEKGWGQGLLLHANGRFRSMDNNQDGFLDQPTGRQGNLVYRWMTPDRKGWSAQFNIRTVWDNQTAGEDPMMHMDHEGYELYTVGIRTRRQEVWGKAGFIFPKKPYQRFGIQASLSNHSTRAVFGRHTYEGLQQTAYVNAIFQGMIQSTNHSYRLGASLLADQTAENALAQMWRRNEATPGVFAEYTYQHLERFSLVAGLRADYSNLFGAFLTPRLNLRYVADEKTVLRFAAGRGQRTPQALAEQMGVFVTSREIILPGQPYMRGPDQFVEIAWNVGAHLSRSFRLDYREGSINLDFYRTQFERQVILDLDANPRQAHFYVVRNGSYANNFQAEWQYEVFRRFHARLAYRWTDVKATYAGAGMRQVPLVPLHRGFLNLAYATRDGWAFDLTVHIQGSQRIPDTDANPEEFRLPGASPAFALLNGQASKRLGKRWEVYLGGENLNNFRQLNPIVDSLNPFGPYFDSVLAWGPVMGANAYAGFRFRVASEEKG